MGCCGYGSDARSTTPTVPIEPTPRRDRHLRFTQQINAAERATSFQLTKDILYDDDDDDDDDDVAVGVYGAKKLRPKMTTTTRY